MRPVLKVMYVLSDLKLSSKQWRKLHLIVPGAILFRFGHMFALFLCQFSSKLGKIDHFQVPENGRSFEMDLKFTSPGSHWEAQERSGVLLSLHNGLVQLTGDPEQIAAPERMPFLLTLNLCKVRRGYFRVQTR